MRALSLIQPWATLVVIGAKKIETRGWRHVEKYRGPLVIHASKRFPGELRELCTVEPFKSALATAGFLEAKALPTGGLLGTAQLVDAYRFVEPAETVPYPERAFGDFTPGRLGLALKDARRFAVPLVPYSGSLGLFNVPDEIPAGRVDACACCPAGDRYRFSPYLTPLFKCPKKCACHDY